MSIERLGEAGPGARFFAVDLHVHTATSGDVHSELAGAGPNEIVEAGLAASLDAIAITDHNTVDACQAVRDAAAESSLVVLPGVEISTPQGHLLAIFDGDHSIEAIRELLIRIGFTGEKYGNVEALSDVDLRGVARAVHDAGGLSIAAHVDKDKGFWRMTEQSGQLRQSIYAEPRIEALECVDLGYRAAFEEGRPGYERQVACVQGSDSWVDGGDRHQLEGIGQRRSYLKLGHIDIRSIRHALGDFRMRVRLEGDELLVPSAVVEGAWVEGGFFNGEVFRFNDGITCFVGGTGSGKSLLIELLRFALDQQPSADDFSAIRKEVDDRLAFALEGGATVSVVVRTDAERFLIQRAWQEGQPSDPVVYRISDELDPLTGVSVPSLFPIAAFSQSEIIEYARRPIARLSLLDRLIPELRDHRNHEVELQRRLQDNAGAIASVEDEIADALEQLGHEPANTARIEALSRFFEAEVVRAQKEWRAEKGYLDRVLDELERLPGRLTASVEELVRQTETAVPDAPVEGPNQPLMRAVSNRLADVLENVRGSANPSIDALVAFRGWLDEERRKWILNFERQDSQYRRLLTEVASDPEGRASLFEELQRLQGIAEDLRRTRRRIEEVLDPRQAELQQQRDELLSELQGVRKAVRDLRQAKANALNTAMDGDVRIKIERWQQTEGYKEKLMALRQGSRVREEQIDALIQHCHPVPLVRSLLIGDFEKVATIAGIDTRVVERLMENLEEADRTSELYDLQVVNVEDGVSIQFALEGGEYRPLESLAHGQKCTAVLMVALAEGQDPLLADQPEDALHAPWIERYIVGRLRALRGRRQCVFASRSPNIVVSADTEQILALTATANTGQVDRAGALEDFETTDLVLYHVEGGREPFQRRQTKYGLA